MGMVTLNNLPLGDIPRVVGTISRKESLRYLAGGCDLGWPSCDLVEIRLDEIGESFDSIENSLKDIEDSGHPIIMTLRPDFEGGKWTSPEEDRLPIFKQALKSIASVDIEYRSRLVGDVCQAANRNGKTAIVSYHDFEKTPNLGKLEDIVNTISSYESAMAKISTMVNSKDDIDTLETLLRKDWSIPVCVIGMGAKGTQTRTSFPLMGSSLSYGYIDTPSAPGQLSSEKLVDCLRMVLPEFNQDVIVRHELLEYA